MKFLPNYTGSGYTEQKCHVLVLSLYNLNLTCQHIGKLKILETNLKSEDILHIYLLFYVFEDFCCDVVVQCPCLSRVY